MAPSLDGVTVIDNLVDEQSLTILLQRFPPFEKGKSQVLPKIAVPVALERHMHSILQSCAQGSCCTTECPPLSISCEGPEILMPARMAVGSSPMHRDNGFDPSDAPAPCFIEGYVAVLYLAGGGSLVIESGSGEHAFEVKPARLIIWPNDKCLHRLDASGDEDARTMIGPMSFTREGYWQRAGDQYAQWGLYANEMSRSYEEQEHPAEAEQPKQVWQLEFELPDTVFSVKALTLGGEVVKVVQIDLGADVGALRQLLCGSDVSGRAVQLMAGGKVLNDNNQLLVFTVLVDAVGQGVTAAPGASQEDCCKC